MELSAKFYFLIVLFILIAVIEAFLVIYRSGHPAEFKITFNRRLVEKSAGLGFIIGGLFLVLNMSPIIDWFINSQWIYTVDHFLKFISFGADSPEVISKRVTVWIIGLALFPVLLHFWKIKTFFKDYKNNEEME